MTCDGFIMASLQTQWLNNVGDLPLLCPLINTETLSVECFNSLSSGFKDGELSTCAPAQYKSIRYDGKVRVFEFPHPLPYFSAIRTFRENWEDVEAFMGSPQSKLKPGSRDDKERVFVMAGYLSTPDIFLRDGTPYGSPDFDAVASVTMNEQRTSLVNFEMMGGKIVKLDIENFLTQYILMLSNGLSTRVENL